MIIELPDGTELDAPDGLAPDKVKAIVQKHLGAAASHTPKEDKSWGTKVRKVFDPTYPSPNVEPLDIGKQAATGLSFAVGGPGLARAALSGGLAGFGLSDAKDPAGLAVSTGTGAVLGPVASKVFSLAGSGLSKAAGYAKTKMAEALGNAANKANQEAAGELASEIGKLGGYSQDLNRKVEWVIRLLDEEKSGALSDASRASLEAFRKSPDYGTVVEKAAERVLNTAPGAVARTAAQEAKVAAMQEGLPQAVVDKTMAATSADEAKNQIKARVLRYGLPAAGSAIGAAMGGPMGAGVGALAGAGTRPMMHALRRMMQNPAVQTQMWEGLGNAAQRGSALMSNATQAAPLLGEEVVPQTFEQYLANLLRNRVRFQAAPADEAQK